MNNQFQINEISVKISNVFPQTILETFNNKSNYVKTIKVDLLAIYTDAYNTINPDFPDGINLRLQSQIIEITDKLSDTYISFENLKAQDFYPIIINYLQNNTPDNLLKQIAYVRLRSGLDPYVPQEPSKDPITSIPFPKN